MNKVILMGLATRDPGWRYSAGESGTAIAGYTLTMMNRRFKRGMGKQQQTLLSCVSFGRPVRVC